MTEVDDRTVTIISTDGVEFTLPAETAKLSGFVNDSLGLDEDSEAELEPLQLLRAESISLNYVIQFLEHHVTDKMPEIPAPIVGSSMAEASRIRWVAASRNGFCFLLIDLKSIFT